MNANNPLKNEEYTRFPGIYCLPLISHYPPKVRCVPCRHSYEHPHPPIGMLSSWSLSCLQLSACSSEYFTRSCAQSWFHRLTWYCESWKYVNSSRRHSLTNTPRACCATIDSLSCYMLDYVLGMCMGFTNLEDGLRSPLHVSWLHSFWSRS